MMLKSSSTLCALLIVVFLCANAYSMQPAQFDSPKSQECNAHASVGCTRLEEFLAYIRQADVDCLTQEKLSSFFEEGLDPAHQVTFCHSDDDGIVHSRTVPLYKWALHVLRKKSIIQSVCKDAAAARLMKGIASARTSDAMRYIDEHTVNTIDQHGNTPLYYAIASVEDPLLSHRFVSALLTYGASPYTCTYNFDGSIKASAVMIAALLWRDNILEHLFKQGVHLASDEVMRKRELSAWKVQFTNADDPRINSAIGIRAVGNLEKTVHILQKIAQCSSV